MMPGPGIEPATHWWKASALTISPTLLTLTQSTTLLMKPKFSYCDQIKFNEPVLKEGTPE